MCKLCYGYIYDVLLSPLANSHILKDFINEKGLKTCAKEVADCFAKATCDFIQNNEKTHYFKLLRNAYEARGCSVLNGVTTHAVISEHEYDKYIWSKFKDINSSDFKEFNYAIQLCMDAMVVKKVKHKEIFIEQFFMHKLRILLKELPDIHKEHTEKKNYCNMKYLGPVQQYRIDFIRAKAGLPTVNVPSISGYSDYVDDLYN